MLSHIYGSRASSTASERKSAEGKTAIVTGSARGIGQSIALRLAADGYGVCINDIPANAKLADEVVEEIRSMGRKSCAGIADVTKRDEVQQLVQTSVQELGPLSTL
jgi:NAD(P)-dependent dehydrogenase (short-subunit alcohol dehydrogenase family)